MRVVLIAIAAWIALAVMRRLLRLFRERITRGMDDPEQVKRAETLGRVFRYVAAVVVLVIATTLILGELGVAVAPILGAAGVVGLAVGFGAQNLVKDYFAGFFILLENQMRQGDVVEIAGKSGLIEEITLRYVRLRDYDGNVHYVSNSLITTVTNMSRGFAYSVLEKKKKTMPYSARRSSTSSRSRAWSDWPIRPSSCAAASRSGRWSNGTSGASSCAG